MTNKKNDLTWVNRLTSEDFLKLWNQENLTKIIANYRYFYSEKDYEGITLQNIRLGFKFLHYENSSKKGEKTNISIKEGYLTFASQLVKHWDELAFKLDKNPDLKFEDFLQIIKFKDKNIKKMDFKDMLSSKFSIALIDKFLDLFANYKNKSAAIEKELEGCNLNTKIKLPTWFEWFVGLKLIYLSNHHLDESIFNLKLDSNYEPHSTHAAGGRADMQGKIWEKDFIVEVTLLYGRAISKSENESVRNHLAKSKPRPNFALFISPEKSYDFNYIVKMGYYDLEGKFYKNEDIEIKCLTIQEFLQFRNLKDLIDH